MKKRILITFGTRALGQRIGKLLADRFELYFASAEEIPSVLLTSEKYLKIPAGLSPTYAHELLKISLDYKIDYILPLGGFELEPLAESKILFEEYEIHILSPDKALLDNYARIENPPKDLPLVLLINGEPILGDLSLIDPNQNGLFVISDSGDEFALCVVSKD